MTIGAAGVVQNLDFHAVISGVFTAFAANSNAVVGVFRQFEFETINEVFVVFGEIDVSAGFANHNAVLSEVAFGVSDPAVHGFTIKTADKSVCFFFVRNRLAERDARNRQNNCQ